MPEGRIKPWIFKEDPKQETYWVNVKGEKVAKYKPVQKVGESYHRPPGALGYRHFHDGWYHMNLAGNKVAKQAKSCDFQPKKRGLMKRAPVSTKCPRCGLTPAQDIKRYGLQISFLILINLLN